jgi:hypothetical protein
MSEREIGLEINGGVCELMAETPSKTLSGGWFSQPPRGLRDQDSNLEPIG